MLTESMNIKHKYIHHWKHMFATIIYKDVCVCVVCVCVCRGYVVLQFGNLNLRKNW